MLPRKTKTYATQTGPGSLYRPPSPVLVGRLQKETVSFVMSAWKQSASTGPILIKFDIETFAKISRIIQVSLKSDKNNGYFT